MIELLKSPDFLLELIIFVPLIGLIINFRPIFKQRPSRLVLFYYSFIVLQWLVAFVMSYNGKNNIIASNIFAVFQFFILSVFFVEILKLNKKSLIPIISVISIISLILVLVLQNDSYNTIFHLTSFILFISSSLIYFFRLLRTQEVDNLLRFPNFYFVTSIIFDFSTSMFIIMFLNYFLVESHDILFILWRLHCVINAITYILITIGFLTCRKTQKY